MPKYNIFAYNNTGVVLDGTMQFGDLAVAVDMSKPYRSNYGGLDWYTGPDEDSLYVIGSPDPFITTKMGLWYDYSMSMDVDGRVWSWGYNYTGQLGDNSVISKRAPVSIHGTKKTFCSIGVGLSTSVGIDNYGQVWSWGNGGFGGLGDNSILKKCTPVSIHGAKKIFCSIGAGYIHSNGLDQNGQIWGWGYNGYGMLGDNSVISKRTPVSIHGTKKTFCSIYVGERIVISNDNHGQLWSWGRNDYGQLGDNSVVHRCTPVSIHGTKKTFCSIGGGFYHLMCIDNYGQVWCWGFNSRGTLGDNSGLYRCTPVSIHGTKKTFCSIGGGYSHSMGVDNYGQVWSWGNNDDGQLGNNSLVYKYTPVSIHGTKKTFCSISGGGNHSMGIDNHDQIWGWGENNYGQLGNNLAANMRTPVRVCL